MLDTLVIKNFAIIEDLEVNFSRGMNVLLGETGAGKSIIIDAISLLKGERSSFEKIRNNATKAFIEGRFLIDNQTLIDQLNAKYESIIEDNELIVTRSLDVAGRTSVKINGQMYSISITKAIMNEIIDIHSQHQNLVILDEKQHLAFLDRFIGKNDLLIDYLNIYHQYVAANAELERLKSKVIDEEECENIKLKLSEIEKLDVKDGELDELEKVFSKMNSFVKLQDTFLTIDNLLDGEGGAKSSIYQAKKALEHLDSSEYARQISELDNAFYGLEEVNSYLKDMLSALNEYEYSSDYLNERIYNLKRLIRKYGETENDVITAKENMEKDLLLASDFDHYVAKQATVVEDLLKKLEDHANKLHEYRVKKSLELEKAVDHELHDLSLVHAHFKVKISRGKYKDSGADDVEFILSTNPGTPYAPLRQIVSGGEASRLMLGLKTIFTKFSPVETIIFDEVDVGVSGKVANQVGKKIHDISNAKQVISISHLPQVSSFADCAFEVKKIVENNQTKTYITELDEEGFIFQIALLLSSGEISNSSIELAKELISKSNPLK